MGNMLSKSQKPHIDSPTQFSDSEIRSHPSGAIPKQHRRVERTGKCGRDSPHPRYNRPLSLRWKPVVFNEVMTDPPGACLPDRLPTPTVSGSGRQSTLLDQQFPCGQFSLTNLDESPDFGRFQLSPDSFPDMSNSLHAEVVIHDQPLLKPLEDAESRPSSNTRRLRGGADVISFAPTPTYIEDSARATTGKGHSDMDHISYIETQNDILRMFPVLRREYSTMSALGTNSELLCWSQVQAIYRRKTQLFEWISDKAKKLWAMASLRTGTEVVSDKKSDWTIPAFWGTGDLPYPFDDDLSDGTPRPPRSPLTLKDHVHRDGISIFLNSHPQFTEEYIINSITLAKLERLYFLKLELEMNKTYNEQRRIMPDLLQIGKVEFIETMKSLSQEPTDQELVWELGTALRKVLEGNAIKIYKVKCEGWEDCIELFSIDDWGPLPGPLMLLKVEPSIQILETLRRKSCMCFTNVSDPVNVEKEWRSLFADSDNKEEFLSNLLCVPVLQADGEPAFIIEVWRSFGYDMPDIEIAVSFMVWGSMSLHFSQMMKPKLWQSNMTEFLLQTVKAIFEEMGSFDHVIKRILLFAQRLVNADRASLFMIDYKNGELVSTVFDMRWNGKDSNKKKEIRMPIGRGIAGHVAITGESVNITDAYSDERFNRSVDEATGYRTTSILCLPIKIEGKTIGVVQMVNKKAGTKFGAEDERAFNLFSAFFGLALQHAGLYDRIVRKEQKYRVALEVLSYHNTCRDSEVVELMSLQPHNPPLSLDNFHLDPFELNVIEKCQAVTVMFQDLFSMNKFEHLTLSRFILTVKKNYRDVPYHNFDHGWSVAQAMYAMLKHDDSQHFSFKQRLALFVASLCHDLDHRGYTNKYTCDTASPLAAMYTTSTLEHHHFNITVTILQQDGHNIFNRFSSEEYKEILGLIKACILATDLAAFFPNLKQLEQLHCSEKPGYDWSNTQHRELAMAIAMTGADLSASAKPFAVQIRTVKVIFDEFYDQGDKERAAGREPINMMDRTKPEEQPASQVGFINQICLPCYDMLKTLLPNTSDMYVTALENLRLWEKQATEVALQKKEEEQRLNDDLLSACSIPLDNDQAGSSGLQKKTQQGLDDDLVQSPITDKTFDEDTWQDAMGSGTEYIV